MKYHIRLECKEKPEHICQEVTQEIYNKINKLLLKELKGGIKK